MERMSSFASASSSAAPSPNQASSGAMGAMEEFFRSKKPAILFRKTRKERVKLVLMEGTKVKIRLTNLYSLIVDDGNPDAEEGDSGESVKELFEQHREVVLEVMEQAFYHYVVKLTMGPKVETTINANPASELLKAVSIIKPFARYCALELKDNTLHRLSGIIKILLGAENHFRIQLEGYRALLAILGAMHSANLSPSEEIIDLFHNAIPFGALTESGNKIPLNHKNIVATLDGTTIVLLPGTNTGDGLMLFKEVFAHIYDMAAHSYTPQVSYFVNLVTTHYFTTLFPGVCKKLGLKQDNESDGFVHGCPIVALCAILDNLQKWLVGETRADTIVKKVIFNSEIYLGVMHEILRQSLILPYTYSDYISRTIGIYRSWMTAFKHQQPSFHRDSNVGVNEKEFIALEQVKRTQSIPAILNHYKSDLELPPDASSAPATISNVLDNTLADPNALAERKTNFYVRIYLRHLADCFSVKLETQTSADPVNRKSDDAKELLKRRCETYKTQLSIFRQILGIYRSLSMDYPLKLEKESWETLLYCLLDITDTILNSKIQYPVLEEKVKANDMTNDLIQTIFAIVVRSMNQNPDIWVRFRTVLSIGTRWPQMITHWANTMNILTSALSSQIYGVDLEKLTVPVRGRKKTGRPRSRSHSGPDFERQGTEASINMNDDAVSMRKAESQEDIYLTSKFFKKGDFENDENTDKQELITKQQIVYFLWNNVLTILGNVNIIKDPVIHTNAMQSLVKILQNLINIRDLGMKIPLKGIPVPPIYTFVEWLFQATELPDAYSGGRAVAFGGLCLLFCRRNDFATSNEPDKNVPVPKRPVSEHVPPEAIPYLPYFYSTLYRGWASNDMTIHFEIVRNCTKLFVLDLPGATMLIPTFINSIKTMITNNFASIPDDIRINSYCILCSLIGYPYLLNNTVITPPCEGSDFLSTLGSSQKIKFIDVRNLLQSAFACLLAKETTLCKNQAVTNEAQAVLVCGLAQLVFQELNHVESLNSSLVDESLSLILDVLKLENPSAVNAAVDALSLIIQSIPTLSDNNKTIQVHLTKIVDKVVKAVKTYMEQDTKSLQEELVPLLLYFLLDCISLCPATMACQSIIVEKILDCLDNTLESNEHAASEQAAKDDSASTATPPSSSQKHTRNTFFRDFKIGHRSNKYETPARQELTGEVSLAKDAARHVLLHVLHFLNNFPSAEGPDRITSAITEEHDSPYANTRTNKPIDEETAGPDNTMYFAVNDSIVLSFIEVPSSRYQGTETRIIVRDCSGKYTWDSYLFFQPSVGMDETPNARQVGVISSFEVLKTGLTARPISTLIDTPTRTYHREPTELPMFDNSNADGSVDMLKELLNYIEHTAPECELPKDETFGPGTDSNLVDKMKEISVYLDGQISLEKREFEKHSLGQVQPIQRFEKILPFRNVTPVSPFHRCRQFLAQFVYLNRGVNQEIRLLQNGAKLQRSLASLDKQSGRDTIKIGVIYVDQGQDEENEILKNDRGSPDYDDLVSTLGWEIDITKHAGYLGNLELSEKSGGKAMYYCAPTLEIIYHVATLMPTDWEDSKQIKKKRHIGNDDVHIVWNDHYRPFAVNTLRGDFGEVQIIITPLPNTLYCVEVYRVKEVPFFGPAVQQMVVDKKTLGPTVRVTAINAHRRLRKMNPGWITPYENRQRLIDSHLKKETNYKPYSFEDFFKRLYVGDTSYVV